MKWLLIVYVIGGHQYGITTEKFKTKQQCEKVGSFIEEKASAMLAAEYHYCLELEESENGQ